MELHNSLNQYRIDINNKKSSSFNAFNTYISSLKEIEVYNRGIRISKNSKDELIQEVKKATDIYKGEISRIYNLDIDKFLSFLSNAALKDNLDSDGNFELVGTGAGILALGLPFMIVVGTTIGSPFVLPILGAIGVYGGGALGHSIGRQLEKLKKMTMTVDSVLMFEIAKSAFLVYWIASRFGYARNYVGDLENSVQINSEVFERFRRKMKDVQYSSFENSQAIKSWFEDTVKLIE